MGQILEIGGIVVFVDSHRMEHKALITAIHGDPLGRIEMPRRKADTQVYETDEAGNILTDYGPAGEAWPCINLVIVSPNEACQDPYGRQLERHSSVVHQTNSSAQGYCFRFTDEVLDPALRQPTVS